MKSQLSRLFAMAVVLAPGLLSPINRSIAASDLQARPQATPTACEALPVNGARFMLANAPIQLPNQIQPLVTIFNQHAYPTVVVFASPDRTKRYQAVVVYPGATGKVTLPVGSYGVIVLVGRTWCDINRGFSDGKTVNVTGVFAVHGGETPSVILQSSGTADGDFTISYNASPARDVADVDQSQRASGYKMELRRRDGHFFASGSLNGFPVVYVVDTGASITSVSRRTAESAGIRDCTRAEFRTANGFVEGCVATVRELSFGEFRVRNVDIAIMPKLAGPALLGMNVLRHYKIEQQENFMYISAK